MEGILVGINLWHVSAILSAFFVMAAKLSYV